MMFRAKPGIVWMLQRPEKVVFFPLPFVSAAIIIFVVMRERDEKDTRAQGDQIGQIFAP
jgi:hypothetical protein